MAKKGDPTVFRHNLFPKTLESFELQPVDPWFATDQPTGWSNNSWLFYIVLMNQWLTNNSPTIAIDCFHQRTNQQSLLLQTAVFPRHLGLAGRLRPSDLESALEGWKLRWEARCGLFFEPGCIWACLFMFFQSFKFHILSKMCPNMCAFWWCSMWTICMYARFRNTSVQSRHLQWLNLLQDLVMRWMEKHREHLSSKQAVLLVLMEASQLEAFQQLCRELNQGSGLVNRFWIGWMLSFDGYLSETLWQWTSAPCELFPLLVFPIRIFDLCNHQVSCFDMVPTFGLLTF